MAKYDITRSCGHVETCNIVGTNVHGERERKAEWLATQLCHDCQATQRAEAIHERAKTLPELAGSPKQIDWALSLRDTALRDVDMYFSNMRNEWARKGHAEAFDQQSAVFIHKLHAHTEAKWWIDHRDATTRQLLAAVEGER